MNKLAERIADAVTVHTRKRVPFEVVAEAAYASDSSLLTAPDRRYRLAQAIEALAAAGSIRLPASADGWDQSARPALPRWVERISEPAAPRLAAPPRAWVDELAFAATTSLSPPERILLTRLNDFLRDGGGDAELIPLRERSYELFREEKRLDNLTESRLVVAGLLSLEVHLRAYPTPPPMPIVELGTAPWALIIENSATFSSLRTVLRHLAEGDRTIVGWLCLGAGKHVIQSITSLAERIAETHHRVEQRLLLRRPRRRGTQDRPTHERPRRRCRPTATSAGNPALLGPAAAPRPRSRTDRPGTGARRRQLAARQLGPRCSRDAASTTMSTARGPSFACHPRSHLHKPARDGIVTPPPPVRRRDRLRQPHHLPAPLHFGRGPQPLLGWRPHPAQTTPACAMPESHMLP